MRPDSYSRPEGQLSHGLSSLIATGERNQAQLQISKFKWGFVAKEQGEGQWMGKLEEETCREGGLSLTHSTEF